MGVESFTVMAILDAQDRASAIFDRVKGVIEQFSSVLGEAATEAEAAGAAIDQSLLQTASGADALALANDRVTASEAKLTLATEQQAIAERSLMDVRAQGLGLTELAAASDKLAAADKAVAEATRDVQAAQETQIAVTRAAAAANDELAASEEAVTVAATGWIGIVAAAALGMAAAGGLAVKAAGDFQSAVVHLTTDAGESAANLKMVSDGLLKLAVDTGTSTDAMAQGMYHIESAGFHGAAGLDMMKVAAEGAKVGNADLDTVSKTLAGTMDSYKEEGYSASQMMNMLIETTAAGDLRMQNLASSLGNVTPIAAAAGLEFKEVGGAIATMTAQNMSAAQATQNLAHLIQSLSKPNNVQIEEMRQMGIDSNDLSQNLGSRGLTGTLDILTEAIAKHTQGGQVFIDSLHNSESAAKDADKMLSLMPASVRKLSEELMNGKMGVVDYKKAIKELSPEQFEMGNQFLSVNEKMGSFNKLLASGKPEAETFNAALSQMTGGQVSLRTALMLTGSSGEYFKTAVDKVGEAAEDTSGKVKNWDTIQGTFNQKLSELKSSFEVLGIQIGEKLMPYVEKFLGIMGKVGDWMMKNKPLVEGVAIALGVSLLTALAAIAVVAAVVVTAVAAIGGAFYLLWEAAKYIWKYIPIVWDAIKTGAVELWHGLQDAWDAIVDGVKTAWNWVADVTSSVWNSIYDFFAKWWPLLLLVFEAPIAVMLGIWNRFHNEITSVAHWVWDNIKSFLKSSWNELSSFASATWDLIYKYVVNPVEKMNTEINRILGDLRGVFVDAFNKVWDWLSSVQSKFYNLGADMVRGIIRGVKDQASELYHAVGDIADGALNFAKKVIDSHSPSRRFADEVGKPIPQGIAMGVRQHAYEAQRAVGDLADSLTGSAGFGAGFSVPFRSTGTANVGHTTIIDMRGSQLMSERDMDVFVDRVGRRLATRILPAGGVRIQA